MQSSCLVVIEVNFQFYVLGLEDIYNLLRNIHICSACSKLCFVFFLY